MNLNERLIDYIKETASVIHTTDGKTISASTMLERFLFPSFMHGLPISKLSGGERRRLFLLKLLMSEPNLLFLDEPTNDLDTQTLTILEEYLETFSGVIVTVSHDRYFLNKVVDELIIFEDYGKITLEIGEYTDVMEKRKIPIPVQTPDKKQAPGKPKQQKKKLSYNEQKEWDVIEEEIETLETRLTTTQNLLNQTGSDYVKAGEYQTEIELIEIDLLEKMERWEQLSELIASFSQ